MQQARHEGGRSQRVGVKVCALEIGPRLADDRLGLRFVAGVNALQDSVRAPLKMILEIVLRSAKRNAEAKAKRNRGECE